MVEKIIINPNKVRGYGNIINQHSTADYTNYACTLTEETDTINGQTMPVYEMEDTILFWDKAVTGMKNTNWQNYSSRLTVTTDENGTNLVKGSANGYYLVNNASNDFEDYICEFDIVETSGYVNWFVESSSNQIVFVFSTYGLVSGTHVKIHSEDGVLNAYVDGVKKTNNITITPPAPYHIGFRIPSGNTPSNLKFKNFIVYGLSSSS